LHIHNILHICTFNYSDIASRKTMDENYQIVDCFVRPSYGNSVLIVGQT